MSKKIVVITGSPRKNGNSFAMTDAFIKAAEAKGHTVTRLSLIHISFTVYSLCPYETGSCIYHVRI